MVPKISAYMGPPTTWLDYTEGIIASSKDTTHSSGISYGYRTYADADQNVWENLFEGG